MRVLPNAGVSVDMLRRIRASNVEWLLPSHGPIFRKDNALLERTISRLEGYLHMADFGTCAIGWPLLEEWEKDGMAIAGSPATVVAEIERQAAELGINYLLSYLFFGTLTLEQALRSLKLMATEVMPKIEKL